VLGFAPGLLIATLWGLGPFRAMEVDPPTVLLDGPEARVQLAVTGYGHDGTATDLTTGRGVRYDVADPAVVRVDDSGEVRPLCNGETRIRVRAEAGGSVEVRVTVIEADGRRPVRFAGEVVPVLTKLGCNAGTCHGKSGGQNGFRLSLLGADPTLDFESLAREGRGRRVFPAAPEASLVLKKPSAQVPHGGGKRFEIGSAEYRTLARWIGQGMPYRPDSEAALISLEARPGTRVVFRGGAQQIRAVAHYADGSERDVTRLADYRSNEPDLVDVNGRGRVTVRAGVGKTAVVVRFGGHVAVARLTVPSGERVPQETPPEPGNLVDRHMDAALQTLGLSPNPPCDDATFARRSSLDLCGLLPTPEDVDAFAADDGPDKRRKWVERLLDRPESADLFAMEWSALLRNKRTLGTLSQPGTFAFHAWVRQAFAENMPYDRFVASILTATGDAGVNPPVVWFRQVPTAEGQADDVAQLFLGVRLQCARCHHHPFERWGQDDYYGFAAFFSRVGRKPGRDPVTPRIFVLPEGTATDPLTGRSYGPRVPGSHNTPTLGPERDPRAALVDWLRRPDNPYFARAVVNRYWKHFFGRGLVEPEDDFRASNPPLLPELLDALADDFVRHGFDLKRLAHTLATSRAYGRSSELNTRNGADRQGFSRFVPRRLPAEVLLDAIDTVCGTAGSFEGLPRGTRAVQLPDEGFDTPGRFLDTFGRPKRETVCGCERASEPSLSQGLHLLNSAEVERKVSHPDGRAARWASKPRPDAERVDALYRLAFARRPTDAERAACLAHLARRRSEGRLRQGFEDLIWAVINTKEFGFVL